MINPIKTHETRQIELKDRDGVVTETVEAKFAKYTYKCRPQVIERQNTWVKFGKLGYGIPKGQNGKGVANQTGPVHFIDDEGQVSQEIEIAKQLM